MYFPNGKLWIFYLLIIYKYLYFFKKQRITLVVLENPKQLVTVPLEMKDV